MDQSLVLLMSVLTVLNDDNGIKGLDFSGGLGHLFFKEINFIII